jgi:hypothetical protein
MLVDDFGAAFRVAPRTPGNWLHKHLYLPGV